MNALATIATCLELGLSIDKIKHGLAAYSGSKRRFEYVGKLKSGALLYDDYAHHPTEIRKTLETFRKKYPNSKIVCVFQPHTYSRTKSLFEHFIGAFYDANELLMMDVYPSEREERDESVSSEKLVAGISKIHKSVKLLPNVENVVEYLVQKAYGTDTVILTMGAGDVYKVKNFLDVE